MVFWYGYLKKMQRYWQCKFLLSQFTFSRGLSLTLVERNRCASAQANLCKASILINKHHKHYRFPDINPIKDSRGVSCWHAGSESCPPKHRPTGVWNVTKSSTMQALNGITHSHVKSTDGDGSTAGVVLFEFKTASNPMDHHILMQKLKGPVSRN